MLIKYNGKYKYKLSTKSPFQVECMRWLNW